MNRRDLLRIGGIGAAAWTAGRAGMAWAAGTPATSAPASAPATQPAGRRFAGADMNRGRVIIIAADGSIEWEHPAPAVGDLWVLGSGNVLFTAGKSVMEVTPEKKVVFKYESTGEVYACQRLANGNTFVGECGAARLVEVTPEGKLAKEIKLLPEGKGGGHMFMRNARVLADGHYLAAHTGGNVVREYDADGKQVWQAAAPSPYAAVRLPGGNTLVSCGDVKGGSKVMELDKDGKAAWEFAQKDAPDVLLAFMTGMHRLPNGNTVMCSWLGHGKLGKGPHLIEVTPEKKIVWTYANHRDVRTVASVQCLDVKGDAVKGELLR